MSSNSPVTRGPNCYGALHYEPNPGDRGRDRPDYEGP